MLRVPPWWRHSAHCPDHLGLTLRAHGCAAQSGRAAAPPRARREATVGLRGHSGAARPQWGCEACSKSPIPPPSTTQVVRRMLGGSDVSRVGPVGGYVDPGAGTAVLTMTLATASGAYATPHGARTPDQQNPGSNPGPAEPRLEPRTSRHTCDSHVCASPRTGAAPPGSRRRSIAPGTAMSCTELRR